MTIKHRVCSLTQIPDDEGLRVEVGGQTVALFRRGGQVFAVGDSCPHMGASLSGGYLDGQTVVCPWHGWVFSLENGRSVFDENSEIPVYPVTVENGDVYVEIEETGSPAPSEESEISET
jgi:NAD(P)H-dependent nitrite reductase small subunit